MSFGNFGSKSMNAQRAPQAPKASGKKPFSSRTIIGVVCVVLALLITFGVAPLVNRFTDQKVDIVRLKADVPRGQIITTEHLEIVNVGSYNLPRNVIKDGKAVVGKYAATDLYAGDYLFDSKLSTNNKSASDVLLGLGRDKVAISVNVANFAAGLSDKLENGDIVSVIIYDKDTVYYYEKTYTVSYDANGGSGAPSSQTKKYTSSLTISSTKPTRTGYIFQGWGTNASDTSAKYSAGGIFTTNADNPSHNSYGSRNGYMTKRHTASLMRLRNTNHLHCKKHS